MSSNAKHHTTVSSFTLPVRLLVQGNVISTTALIDSGAAGNFIYHKFAVQCKLQLNPCHSSLTVEALDGRPLGEGKIHRVTEVKMHIGSLHSESISVYVIHAPHHSIILGFPWLQTHNPCISWRERQIIQWDTTCHDQCLSKVTRIFCQVPDTTAPDPELLNLPSEYADLS